MMYEIIGGNYRGSFAEIQEHPSLGLVSIGNAYCSVISKKGSRTERWVRLDYLGPCRKLKVEAAGTHAIAVMTNNGVRFDIEGSVPIQTEKFFKDKQELQDLLESLLFHHKQVENSGVSQAQYLEERVDLGVPQQELEDSDSVESEYFEEPEEDSEPEAEAETEDVTKSNILLFPSQSTVIEPPNEETPPTENGTEEEDWTHISLEREQRCQAIASQLIKLSQDFSTPITDFLWELNFVVFQDDRRKKSREYGTFEQMCRHLHENGFPYHPNTAREKANAEQQRRILNQLGVTVEVKSMSDTAALELRKIDSFRDAEPEVILAAKKQVVEAAEKLTKEGISSSIKSLSVAHDWESNYKFRYNPKPKKRQSGEKAQEISREDVEKTQNLNTLLRRQVEQLQSEVSTMALEMIGITKEIQEKVKKEMLLTEMVKMKDEEIERLKQELEEARRMRAIAS